MRFIRRDWSTAEADEWTKEDWLAIIVSPVAYILIMIGVALSFLLLWQGFVVLALGIVATVLMHWIFPSLSSYTDITGASQCRPLVVPLCSCS